VGFDRPIADLLEYLSPDRGTTAKDILYWVSHFWHPSCIHEICLIILTLYMLHRFSRIGFFQGRLSKNNGAPCIIVSVYFSA